MKLFDERDTLFSRLGLIKGTKKYRDYYAAHPGIREEDDRVRDSVHQTMARIFRIDPALMKKNPQRLSVILKTMNAFYDLTGKRLPMDSDRMMSMGAQPKEDDFIWSAMTRPAAHMANLLQREADKRKVSARKVKVNPEEMSALLKTLALTCGGDVAGIARLKNHHHYSHRGDMFGMGGGYGKPIRLSYPFAIVIAVALDQTLINRAPRREAQIAAMLGYAGTAAATAQLALYIKSLGYEARTDNFLEYYSPMTPLAADAGLGQIGRCNMVVHQAYGNRLKIGAVLTNMPLVEDGPVDFGLVEFCGHCKRCARNCPAGAISFGEPEMINGILQWPHDGAKCMEMWMTVGTGVCMASCPFSQGTDRNLHLSRNRDQDNLSFTKDQDSADALFPCKK